MYTLMLYTSFGVGRSSIFANMLEKKKAQKKEKEERMWGKRRGSVKGRLYSISGPQIGKLSKWTRNLVNAYRFP